MKLDINKVNIALASGCMTLTEVSEITGLKDETISKVLRNKQNARPKTIGLIAKALGKSVEEIILN